MHNRNPYTQIKQLGFAKEVLLKFAIFLISYVQLYLVLLSFPFPCMLDIIHTVLKQRLQRLSLKKILRKLLYTCFISTGCMFQTTLLVNFLFVCLLKNNTCEHFLHSTNNYLKNDIMLRNMRKISLKCLFLYPFFIYYVITARVVINNKIGNSCYKNQLHQQSYRSLKIVY